MNGSSCLSCHSYNRGKGTKACLTCLEFKDILPEKPNPDIIRLPKELLENLNCPPKNLASVFELISKLEPISATMLLQSTLLKMTCREIASYHQGLYHFTTCQRKITEALDLIGALAVLQPKKN